MYVVIDIIILRIDRRSEDSRSDGEMSVEETAGRQQVVDIAMTRDSRVIGETRRIFFFVRRWRASDRLARAAVGIGQSVAARRNNCPECDDNNNNNYYYYRVRFTVTQYVPIYTYLIIIALFVLSCAVL